MVESNVTRMNSDFSVPITQLRTKIKMLVTSAGIINRSGSNFTVDSELATAIGVPTSGTYATEDAVVDAVLHAWFPQAFSKAA